MVRRDTGVSLSTRADRWTNIRADMKEYGFGAEDLTAVGAKKVPLPAKGSDSRNWKNLKKIRSL